MSHFFNTYEKRFKENSIFSICLLRGIPAFIVKTSLLLGFILFIGCGEKPLDVDGNSACSIMVIDTSELADKNVFTGIRYLKNESITFQSKEYNISYTFNTDEKGIVSAKGLPASKYLISVNKLLSESLALFGSKEKDIYGSQVFPDTLFLKSLPISDLIINEIFYTGSPNKYSYSSDLFIELYNNSNNVKFLDGIIVSRVTYGPGESIAIRNLDDKVVLAVLSTFQFPGTPGGNRYPIYPGQYAVIAGDAVDHRIASPVSIDLSYNNKIFGFDQAKAQLWEFYDALAGDADNQAPNVNNVFSIRPSDFELSFTGDAVVISSGKKGIITTNDYYPYIDITTILDGVQFKNNPDFSTKLDSRIDGGCAGIGIIKYSGKSVERLCSKESAIKHLDNNNSTIDFGINDRPTPGYQGNPQQ